MAKPEVYPLLKIASLILIIFNLFVTSFFLLNGELDFHSDIARDFLLLNEIEAKKIVLIGGSTSIAGVYHGPFWLYLNFPAYYLGGGNPIAVGWFLLSIIIAFTLINFQIAKKLAGPKTAYFFTIFISSFLIVWGRAFNHPEAALLLAPSFFYTLLRYLKTFKLRYLCIHVLTAGLIIQLEIASGGPFFLLSSALISYQLIKNRKLNHFLAFVLILIPLSSYIIFELRHDFFQFKNFIKYIQEAKPHLPLIEILKNRAGYASAIGSLAPSSKIINVLSTLLFLSLIIKSTKENKNRHIYLTFLYLYLGYFSITMFSNHYLLAHQLVPLVALAMMTFLSLVETRFAKFVLPLILIMILVNEVAAAKYLNQSKNILNSPYETSWKIISRLADDVFETQESEFGYFIYSPDKLSYVPKYAMVYAKKRHREKTAAYFEKKPVTYVISAPAPLSDPYAKYFTDDYWIVNSIKITKEPQNVIRYPNGYTIKRYELSKQEIAVPFDKYEDTGIHFR